MGGSAFVCDVGSGGISHVFTPLAVGAVCACGRMVAGLSEDERRLEMRRVDPWPAPRRAPAPAPAWPAGTWERDSEGLLIRGGATIAHARSLRAQVAGERAERNGRRAGRPRAGAR
jgi:hypothetical protein